MEWNVAEKGVLERIEDETTLSKSSSSKCRWYGLCIGLKFLLEVMEGFNGGFPVYAFELFVLKVDVLVVDSGRRHRYRGWTIYLAMLISETN